MFRPARMQKISIVTLNQYTKPLVDALYERGLMEIEDLAEEIHNDDEYKGLTVSKQDPFATKISSLAMKCDSIIDTLKSSEPKTSMVEVIKGFFSPKEIFSEEVKNLSPEELAIHAEKIITKVDSVLSPIESRMNEIGTEETKYKDNLNIANQLKSFDVDFAYLQNNAYTSFITGLLPQEHLADAKSQIEEATQEVVIFEGSPDSESKDKTVIPLIIVTLNEFEEDISGILRRLEFEKLDVSGLSGKASEIVEASAKKLEDLKNDKEQCIKDIREVDLRSRDQMLILKEQLDIEKQRTEIYSYFGETETTKMIKGWVVKKDVDETLTIIDQVTEGNSVIEVEDPSEEEIENNEVPVKQKNPGFAKPYELLVNMYSTPNYKDIDPTIIMAFFFPFFFGFCLTDAFYGVIIAIIGFLIYRGIGKVNKTFTSFGAILTQMGLWTVLLGLVTGGFIGDFVPRFLMGDANAALPTVIPSINAFAHPENILILAIIIGLVHLNIAFLFGIIDNVKSRKIKDLCSGQLCWVLIEISIVLFVVAGMIPFAVTFIIALILLIYGAGAMGVMDIFGFIGDVLSYSRLLALCLSTGGIAMTANLLFQLLGQMVPYVGVVIGILVFLAIHLFNIAFQSLGSFIHSLRLHFVEFFGNFYTGDSEPFEPFEAERVYTKVEK